jgi:pyruvate dehydrogenase E1 component alpha subunit
MPVDVDRRQSGNGARRDRSNLLSTKQETKSSARKSHNGKLAEPADKLVEYYREMMRIRVFEEQTVRAYRQGLAGGYLHVYEGMEATAVGWLTSIAPGDPVITAYRDHGHALTLGCDPVAVLAEIMGRSRGLSGGKGGSMHLYSKEHNFYGGWGIVGGHIPLGVGLSFATKYKGGNEVTHCFFGDGAANAGVVYEVLNMASLWDLPVILIIENNEFAMGTRLEYHAADPELHRRAEGFNVEHERIDGMDVLALRKDAKRIIDRVRKTQRPYLVEIMNYRFAGHGAADNDQNLYRSPEEVERARKRDPLHLLGSYLTDHGVLSDKELDKLHEDIEAEMNDVFEKASQSPKPEPEAVYENVYSDMSPEKGH